MKLFLFYTDFFFSCPDNNSDVSKIWLTINRSQRHIPLDQVSISMNKTCSTIRAVRTETRKALDPHSVRFAERWRDIQNLVKGQYIWWDFEALRLSGYMNCISLSPEYSSLYLYKNSPYLAEMLGSEKCSRVNNYLSRVRRDERKQNTK